MATRSKMIAVAVVLFAALLAAIMLFTDGNV
jgi:hypothetical protein